MATIPPPEEDDRADGLERLGQTREFEAELRRLAEHAPTLDLRVELQRLADEARDAE